MEEKKVDLGLGVQTWGIRPFIAVAELGNWFQTILMHFLRHSLMSTSTLRAKECESAVSSAKSRGWVGPGYEKAKAVKFNDPGSRRSQSPPLKLGMPLGLSKEVSAG